MSRPRTTADESGPLGLIPAARRLVAGGVGVIGLVPMSSVRTLAPLMAELARTLENLEPGAVGTVPPWREWAKQGSSGATPFTAGLREVRSGREAAATLARILPEARARARVVLVDLSDIEPLILRALREVDRVALVARAGRTSERPILKLARAFTSETFGGVLLID